MSARGENQAADSAYAMDVMRYKAEMDEMAAQLAALLEETAYKAEMEQFCREYSDLAKRNGIYMVVAGEFSTGKSTIIKVLTEDESIRCGAGIQTRECTKYQYKGEFYLIDTPGLLSGNDEDTKKANAEISKADIMLYCVNNELFSNESWMEFKRLQESFRGRIILAVTMLEKEATGGKSLTDVANQYKADLRKKFEEDGLDYYRFDRSFFSAALYQQGKANNDEDMILDSCFLGFIDLLNDHDTGQPDSMLEKCRRQQKMILDFTGSILEKQQASRMPKGGNGQKEQELTKKINAAYRKAVSAIRQIYREHVDSIGNELDSYRLTESDGAEAVGLWLNDRISQASVEAFEEACWKTEDFFAEECSEVDELNFERTEQAGQVEGPNIKKAWKIPNIFKPAGQGTVTAVHHVNKVANKSAGGFFQRVKNLIVKPKPGGKGTALYKFLDKLPGNMQKLAPGIAKAAETALKSVSTIMAAASVAQLAADMAKEVSQDRRQTKFGQWKREMKDIIKSNFHGQRQGMIDQVGQLKDNLLEKARKSEEFSQMTDWEQNLAVIHQQTDNLGQKLAQNQ